MTNTTTTLARPTTTADLAARIVSAGEAGAAGGGQVRVTGSGSMPMVTMDEGRAVAEISTLRMNKVVEQSAGDMVVGVQAGMTLEALQRQLAWQDQWLPVDPPGVGGRLPGQRTIGGLIATNSLGPLRFGMGDWRLLVLGMKWVDAQGTVMASGSRTVKNVAGYAAHRMMIGTCGELGVIAEVTLRTFARPADEKCVILFCESAAQAEGLVAAVLLSATTPAYVEIVGGGTFAGNPLGLPTVGSRGRGMAVVVGFLGRAETCTAQVEIVRSLPAAAGAESISQTAAQAGRLRLWMTTEPALSAEVGAGGIGFRLHGRSSQVAELVAGIEGIGGDSTWVVSEAATGVVRGVLPRCEEHGRLRFERLCEAAGARVMYTQGTRLGAEGSGLAARLKTALDPAGRFGRVAWGAHGG